MQALSHKLIKSFNSYPERNAFYIKGVYYSYLDIASRIIRIQNALGRTDPDKKLVGIVAYDVPDTYCAIIATLLTGNTFVPINPKNPKDRNNAIIRQAGLKYVITGNDKTESDPVLDTTGLTVISGSELPQGRPEMTSTGAAGRDAAYLLFTSGTTGIPKGVPITYGNLQSFIDGFFALGYRISPEDRFLQMFDLSFDLSVMSYLIPLCAGACVYTVPHEGILYTHIYDLLENRGITFALMVPSVLAHLRPYFGEIRLEKMRYSLFCGEALYEDITDEWAQCVPNAIVHNVYGPTEATIFCLAYNRKRDIPMKSFNGIVCIGKPMKHVKAVVVNEKHRPVPVGVKGELCIGGGQTTPGYWNDVEKNKEAFFELNGASYYKTGDIAFSDDEGDFYFVGRMDQQVKVQGGYRVELSEIEHCAREFLPAGNVAAVSLDTGTGIPAIYLAVENHYGELSSLREYLRKKLPYYMIPAKILSFKEFPLNVNGKTDRKKIEEMIRTTHK
ncbi:MAG: AMP-binding protein [Bacteroidetes bacterium]|nr:AMP-binding protein [Bacteroidota bacterium]